jgi:hypothetical protein
VLKGPSSAEGILHGKRCSIQIQIRNPWNTLWEFCMLLKIGFGIVPHIHNKKTTMYLSQPHWSSSILVLISKAWILLVVNLELGLGVV